MELLWHLKCGSGDSLEIVFTKLYICFNSVQLMENISVTRDNYLITTDKAHLDLHAVHQYLSKESYWSRGIPFETVKKAAEHSLTFIVLCGEEQVGYARIISDYAIFAYLGDVYILDAHRGKGLSKWLMETIMGHPELQGLRRWTLATRDAHGLYAQHGWKPVANPAIWMEVHNPDPYGMTNDSNDE